MSEIHILRDAAGADAFRSATFPAFRHWLDFDPDWPAPIAAAARVDGVASALALAIPADDGAAELLSVYCVPEHRRRGIALALMQALESECRRRERAAIIGTYMTGQPGSTAFEGLLARHAFAPPETRMLVVRCTLDSIARAPWIRPRPLPSGYALVPWVQLTQAQRDELSASHAKEPWIAPDLVPFDFEDDIEPKTSHALLVKGAVRGWCINHAVGGALRYTCAFVHPRLQRLGRVLWLYRAAVACMPEAGFDVGMWTVPVWHPGHATFAREHMAPYAVFFGETRGFRKELC